jgi:nitrite reductase (cytochrome c-552)
MKQSTLVMILTAIIIILAAGLVGVLIFMKNQPLPERGVAPLVEVAAMEPDSSIWGTNFSNQYSSLLKTYDNNTRTTYGGSEQFSKLEADPRLLTLFAGYAFSIEYNEERGHLRSLEDVQNIARVNETTHATCYSCKSSNNPSLWDEMGMEAYDAMMFSEMTPLMDNPIGCANCHEAETMRLIVTNPALENALEAQGLDWTTFTRQEMRTVVCGNCHVEYYFEGDDKLLVFPWANGTRIEEIYAYYEAEEFTDWTHPDSGAPLLKAQHPEFEIFTADSTHYAAGVACADCHMPYTRDGAAKYSNHNVHSPLLNAEAACGTCHTDVAYVTTRVAMIQAQVYATLINTEDTILAAISSIKTASETSGVDATLLEQARQYHREAQMYWDLIAAENSMGFHNPEYVLTSLYHATDVAYLAQLAALQAMP